jgi:hypothetical protein
VEELLRSVEELLRSVENILEGAAFMPKSLNDNNLYIKDSC